MNPLQYLMIWVSTASTRVRRPHDADADFDSDGDRGDVPGWVMVTVMTAILVVAILGVFETPLKNAITDALNKVTSSK